MKTEGITEMEGYLEREHEARHLHLLLTHMTTATTVWDPPMAGLHKLVIYKTLTHQC